MRPERRGSAILRSGALRLSAAFALVFAAACVLYVAGVHLAVGRYAETTLRGAIDRESALLQDGATSASAPLALRAGEGVGGHVAVFARDGHRIVGDLPAEAAREGWSTVTVPGAASDEGEPVEVLCRGTRLGDGGLLVVGRSLGASADLVEWLDAAALWSAAGVVVLALVGGWLIAWVVLRRLDRVGSAMDRIVSGAFSERLPAIGMGAEFDALANRVNAMLDTMVALMEGQRDLSAHLAHELRTPLTRVHQRLESALAIADDPGMREALEAAGRELEALGETFSALLRLARIERGDLRRRFAPVDLSALARDVVEVFGAPAEDVGMGLAVVAPTPMVVLGDADLLAQVLANLVRNALVHAGKGTSVVVEVGRVGGDAFVAVEDDGPGVAEADRPLVVRRFGRSAAAGASGAGLGLALVDAIAMLHGGRLALGSGIPGDAGPGLRAVVSCPLADRPGTGGGRGRPRRRGRE